MPNTGVIVSLPVFPVLPLLAISPNATRTRCLRYHLPKQYTMSSTYFGRLSWYNHPQYSYLFIWVCSMDYGPHPIEYTCWPWQRYLYFLLYSSQWYQTTAACNNPYCNRIVGICHVTATPSDRIHFHGCVAWTMVHTPLSMHMSHVRGICLPWLCSMDYGKHISVYICIPCQKSM